MPVAKKEEGLKTICPNISSHCWNGDGTQVALSPNSNEVRTAWQCCAESLECVCVTSWLS
jgi:hypothetical protein